MGLQRMKLAMRESHSKNALSEDQPCECLGLDSVEELLRSIEFYSNYILSDPNGECYPLAPIPLSGTPQGVGVNSPTLPDLQ